MKRWQTRLLAPVLLVGMAVAAGLTTPAQAADAGSGGPRAVNIVFACQANPPIGSAQAFTINASITGTAPATVPAGGNLTVTLKTNPISVPSNVGGNTVQNIHGLDLLFVVPANSSYQSATISGGSGLGGTPSVGLNGQNQISLQVPGPIPGGSTFELPTLAINLKAGNSGTIAVRLAGTSLNDPGLTGTATASAPVIGSVDVPFTCYPNPNQDLTDTTIH